MDLFTLASLLPALIVAILALVSARLFVRNLAVTQTHEFASIDGLRGLLALGVFIHHAIYWYAYATSGNWYFYSSGLYMNFGHASVSLFFMLTGFLFTLKLIDGRSRGIDWLKLYCSRFMRLTPLYFCLCLCVFTIVAINTHFQANDSADAIMHQLRDWLLFVIPGKPDINGYPDTQLLTAGVVWTLPYEWYFYLMLPCLGLLIGTRNKSRSRVWLPMSLLFLISFSSWGLDHHLFYGFAGGAVAAFVTRTPWLREQLSGRLADFAVIACLVIGYTCFDYSSIASLCIFTVTLTLVACGASVFGFLKTQSARALSSVSYGVYLLQGIVLYVVLMYMVPTEFRLAMSVHQYWGFVFLCTPLLVGVSALSWHFIESPAINASPKLAQWIRNIRAASTVKLKPVAEDAVQMDQAAHLPLENNQK